MAKRTSKSDPQDPKAPERGRRSVPPNQADETVTTRPVRNRRKTVRTTDNTEERAVVAGRDDAAAPANPTGPAEPLVSERAPESADVPHEHIAVRAYHIYLERGGRSGNDFADWIAAERELRARAAGNRSR
jgi:hypothetical protein